MFAWRLQVAPGKKHPEVKIRIAYTEEGTLCGFPGADYPVIKTGINVLGKSQLVLIDQEKKEMSQSLNGVVTSLIHSPVDPTIFVVGYQNGDVEMRIVYDGYTQKPQQQCQNLDSPFIFNPHGTQLVGTRGSGIVIIPIAQSAKESDVIGNLVMSEQLNVLKKVSLVCQQEHATAVPSKKKKKSDKRKEKKGKSR